jgi:hypothetical protein
MPKHFQAMLRSDVRPRELWAWAVYDRQLALPR